MRTRTRIHPYVRPEISKRLFYVRSYVLKNGRLFLSMMADGGVFELEPLP